MPFLAEAAPILTKRRKETFPQNEGAAIYSWLQVQHPLLSQAQSQATNVHRNLYHLVGVAEHERFYL